MRAQLKNLWQFFGLGEEQKVEKSSNNCDRDIRAEFYWINMRSTRKNFSLEHPPLKHGRTEKGWSESRKSNKIFVAENLGTK